MPERGSRLVVAMLLVPIAGIAAFFIVGRTSGLVLAHESAGLVEAGTVALLAVGAFLIAALVAAWASIRLAWPTLLRVAAATALLAVAGIAWTILRVPGPVRPTAGTPADTTAPFLVRGGDSLLAMMRLGAPPSDGSGLLPAPLDLHGGPSSNTPTVTTVTRWSDLVAEEVAYEEPAIAVYRIAHPWYLVATRDSVMGWMELPREATVVPLVELLPERLSYLTTAWDGRVFDTPASGAGHPVDGLVLDHGEASVRVLRARQINDALWIELQVHGVSPCESMGDPPILATGWVPLWTRGKPTVWFYSRGC